MTRSHFLTSLYTLLVLGLAAELVREAVAGDHWRTFCMAVCVVCACLVAGELTKRGEA